MGLFHVSFGALGHAYLGRDLSYLDMEQGGWGYLRKYSSSDRSAQARPLIPLGVDHGRDISGGLGTWSRLQHKPSYVSRVRVVSVEPTKSDISTSELRHGNTAPSMPLVLSRK
jgi:hypothetical protein